MASHDHSHHHRADNGVDISLERSPGGHSNMNAHRGMLASGQTPEPSGSSWAPESTPMEGIHTFKKDWLFMVHGFANAGYTMRSKANADTRGSNELFTTNMLMFMGIHPMGKGAWSFRAMGDLEPVMGPEGYPLLLQTGESADGIKHLIDRQHPHDMIMELSSTLSYPVSQNGTLFTYLALPGEPALGPPAYMHRFSGYNNPTAPITHHWFDATHVTMGVATLGYVWKNWKVDGSIFTGREPDDRRWDIEQPKFDSQSARVSYNPTENFALQASYGHLSSPEQVNLSLESIDKVNATAVMNWLPPDEVWQFMVGWGINMNRPGAHLNAFLFELTRSIRKTHTLFGRVEVVSKDELFLDGGPNHVHSTGPSGVASLSAGAGESKVVNKFSGGYIYDILKYKQSAWGLGAQLSLHVLPQALELAYGSPVITATLFARVKLL